MGVCFLEESSIKNTNNYETVIVMDNSLGQERLGEITEKFKILIEENAIIEDMGLWGRRRLAYPIDHKTEGYYVYIEFKSPPEFSKELQRVARLTSGVLRAIIIKKVKRKIKLKKKTKIYEQNLGGVDA